MHSGFALRSLVAQYGAALERLQQAFAQNAVPGAHRLLELQLGEGRTRRDHILDLHRPLFVRVDVVVFPEVFAHELGVRVEAAPVVLRVAKDLLDVLVVLPGTLGVLLHLFLCGTLLGEHLLYWPLVQRGEVGARSHAQRSAHLA